MKKVICEYGCRALGYTTWEGYVEDDMSEDEIRKKIEDITEFYMDIDIEEGYEETIEVVYRKKYY